MKPWLVTSVLRPTVNMFVEWVKNNIFFKTNSILTQNSRLLYVKTIFGADNRGISNLS